MRPPYSYKRYEGPATEGQVKTIKQYVDSGRISFETANYAEKLSTHEAGLIISRIKKAEKGNQVPFAMHCQNQAMSENQRNLILHLLISNDLKEQVTSVAKMFGARLLDTLTGSQASACIRFLSNPANLLKLKDDKNLQNIYA